MKNELYVPRYFETRLTAVQGASTPNAIGRILNSIARTFNIYRYVIPKWIVIIPETDLIRSVEYTEFGVSGTYGTIIEYMMKEVNNMVKTFLRNDSSLKNNRYNHPFIVWIEPVLHSGFTDNALRVKFIRSMHNAAQGQERMVILSLKQSWKENDSTLIQPSLKILNQKGLNLYCTALDNTLRFADTKVMRNYGLPLKNIFQKQKIREEMEKRVTLFEKTSKLMVPQYQQMTMMRQQHYRQQYNQVRRFFEQRDTNRTNRTDNDNNRVRARCTNKSTCKRELFKKD